MDRELLKMALILGLMSVIGPFSIDMYLPALPTMVEDFGAEPADGQLTLTAYFIAFAVAQLFYGPASDMFGRKGPLYFGMGLFAAASIGSAFAPTIEMLWLFRFLQGLGAAGVMSIPRAVIRDRYTGAKATRLMSTVMLVIAISPMLAPLIGSFIITPFGWRAVFLAVTLTAIFAMLVNFFALPETLAPEKRIPFKAGEMFKSFGILLRDPGYLGLTFIGGLGMSAFFTFLGSASFVYMDYFGLTPHDFALAFAANALGFFTATQFASNVMQWFGPVRLMRGATFAYAAITLAMLGLFLAGVGSLPLMIGMLLVANLFFGFIMPSAMVLALEDHGPIAGAAASLGGTLQMVLATICMGLGSLFFDGTPIPMLAIIAACGSGGFVLALLTVRDKAEAQPA